MKKLLVFFTPLIFTIGVLVSCNAYKKPETIYNTSTLYVPIVETLKQTEVKHDTIKIQVKQKPRTAAELRKQYGSLIDTLFSPEFDNLTTILRQQQTSIVQLSGIITSMRGRSIAYRDSMQHVDAAKDNELYELKKSAITESQKQQRQNTEQIRKLNTIINVLVVYCIMSLLLILALALVCRILWIAIKPSQRKYE